MNLDADGGSDGDGIELKVRMTRIVTYGASLWFDGVRWRQRDGHGLPGRVRYRGDSNG